MSDVWSERAELYRQSAAHSGGADLDLVVEWAAGCTTAIDVATGGGHVTRRLREAGLEVVSCDPSPGMQPSTVRAVDGQPLLLIYQRMIVDQLRYLSLAGLSSWADLSVRLDDLYGVGRGTFRMACQSADYEQAASDDHNVGRAIQVKPHDSSYR